MVRNSATTHSAISILNAIGTGRGGAIGIDLKCKVTASLERKKKANEPSLVVKTKVFDKHALISKCVDYVLHYYSLKIEKDSKLVIEIASDIPTAVGLKSSSAVSTAVVQAVAKVLGRQIEPRKVLELSCKASKASGASITGALDDAAACFLGGLVLTDNKRFRVLKHAVVPENFGKIALVRIPKNAKRYTSSVQAKAYARYLTNSKHAFELAEKGNMKGAMLLNSLVQCSVLGYSFDPVMSAIFEGASCAGVSGKGPAIAALCASGKIATQIEKRWYDEAADKVRVIKTRIVQPPKGASE